MFPQLKVATLKCDTHYWECQGKKAHPLVRKGSLPLLCTRKIGQQPNCIIQCIHGQLHQPGNWGGFQAHLRGTGAMPPQRHQLFTVASPLTCLPPTVTTLNTPNLLQWVTLPSPS